MTGRDMRREPRKLVSVADKWLPTMFCTFLSEWRAFSGRFSSRSVADSRPGLAKRGESLNRSIPPGGHSRLVPGDSCR
jgi:hypothetical protein